MARPPGDLQPAERRMVVPVGVVGEGAPVLARPTPGPRRCPRRRARRASASCRQACTTPPTAARPKGSARLGQARAATHDGQPRTIRRAPPAGARRRAGGRDDAQRATSRRSRSAIGRRWRWAPTCVVFSHGCRCAGGADDGPQGGQAPAATGRGTGRARDARSAADADLARTGAAELVQAGRPRRRG